MLQRRRLKPVLVVDVCDASADAFGPVYKVSGQQALPFIAAAGLIATIAALLVLIAARTTVRHDVTRPGSSDDSPA